MVVVVVGVVVDWVGVGVAIRGEFCWWERSNVGGALESWVVIPPRRSTTTTILSIIVLRIHLI